MEKTSRRRPDFLSALCILTFIGSGIAFLGYFAASLFFEAAKALIVQYTSWQSAEILSPLYFTLLMVLYALSLTGAIRMWKRHRDGFWLYLIAQGIILFLPVIWIDGQAFSATNALFTALFTGGYGMNLKWLR